MSETMNAHPSLEPQINRARGIALVAGVAAIALAALTAHLDPTQFFRSYLVAYLYWVSVALGCLGIVMLHHLVGGGWGFLIRRLLESAIRTLLGLAALFVPLLFGLSRLYLWAQPGSVAADPILMKKRFYLNPQCFTVRATIYFGAWIVLAFLLNKWSAEQDRTANPVMQKRLSALSGPGMVVYGLTITLAAIDWIVSLEPHWFSTVYGLLFIMVQALTAMSFITIVVMMLSGGEPLRSAASPAKFHDLGNLLFSFVMLWAYLAFAQFLIIWSGNLQEEVPWYLARTTGGWAAVALLLVFFHFAVPFFVLLMRPVKRNPKVLGAVALLLMVMSLMDLFWLIVPAFGQTEPRFHWMDLLAFVGLGGVWVWMFLSQLKRQPLLPLHDPRFQGVLGHAE
jgi:hypothetical protein